MSGEIAALRVRLSAVIERLEPLEEELQLLEKTFKSARDIGSASEESGHARAHDAFPELRDVAPFVRECELDGLPEPPSPQPLVAPLSVDVAPRSLRPPRPPEALDTRPLVPMHANQGVPLSAAPRRQGRAKWRALAWCFAALMVFSIGGAHVGKRALVTFVEGRLERSGVTAQVSLNLGLRPELVLEGLVTERPLHRGGLGVSVEADTLTLSVDPMRALLGGSWLAEPASLVGLRLHMAEVHQGPSSVRESTGRSVRARVLDASSRWCSEGCRVAIRDASLSLEAQGIEWGGWSELQGEATLSHAGVGALAVNDSQGRSLALEVPLAAGLDAGVLEVTGRHEAQLELNRVAQYLGVALPPDLRVSGSAVSLSHRRGVLTMRGVEGTLSDPHGRRLDANIAQVALPSNEGPREMIALSDLQGVSARLELPERGVFLLDLARVSFEGAPLAPCEGELWCPSRLEGLRFSAPEVPELFSAFAFEAARIHGCGGACISLANSAYEVRRGNERLESAWRSLEGELSQGQLRLSLDGGHAEARLKFEGIAEDHRGLLVPVAPEAFDAADALAAFRLRPQRRPSKRSIAKEQETGRLIRTFIQAADRVIAGVLNDWPEVARLWSRRSATEGLDLRVTDARYDVALGPLPALRGRVERLEGEVMPQGLSLSADLRLAVPEALHLPAAAQVTSIPASVRGLWGGPGYLEGRIDVSHTPGGTLSLAFEGRTPWLHFSNERIALERIDIAPLDVSATLHRRDDATGLAWELEALDLVAAQGGHLHISAEVALEHARKRGHFQMAAELPMQDCAALHQSVPTAMLYGLQGARFRGEAGLSFTINYPLHSVEGLDISVGADFEGCVADTLGEDIDLAALNASDAVFDVYDHRLKQAVQVGPGTGNWVSLSSMPSHVWGAAMATEDFNFFSHQGFSRTFIGRALRLNLRTRRYAYGGGTITQQLIKNLFLTRHKTLARKLVEAVLVWQVERHVSKRRILALYVNCIEYGPRIYGIRAAARRYFRTSPAHLSPVESAFIMNIKPFPWTGYWIFKKRMLTTFFAQRAEVIKQRLLGRGYINAAEAERMVANNLYARFVTEF